MVKWDAQEYNRSSSAQRGWARELISKLALRPTEHVLDLGCGDGKTTADIAGLVRDGRVVGVDKSEEMIGFASQEFPACQWPNLSFAVMDASALTFDGEFDVVFSNAVLHWVIDHRPVLRGIEHALKPGGRCLLQMAGRGNASGFIEAIFDAGPVHDEWGHYFAGMDFPYGFYGPEEYLPWIEDSGLTPVRVELLPKDMVQQGAEGLAGWMRTTWLPYTQRIPEEGRERFISESIARYLGCYPLDDQGMAHVSMVRLEVEVVKL